MAGVDDGRQFRTTTTDTEKSPVHINMKKRLLTTPFSSPYPSLWRPSRRPSCPFIKFNKPQTIIHRTHCVLHHQCWEGIIHPGQKWHRRKKPCWWGGELVFDSGDEFKVVLLYRLANAITELWDDEWEMGNSERNNLQWSSSPRLTSRDLLRILP